MALTGQLDVFTVIGLNKTFLVESVSVGEIHPETDLHFVSFHRLEEHVWREPVLHRNLVIKPIIKRSLESEEPATPEILSLELWNFRT